MYFRSKPPRRLHIPLLLTLLLTITGVQAQGPGQAVSTGLPQFQFSSQTEIPVIEYRLVHQLLAEQDPEPLLRVYGNGRVHAHFPAYMKRAGDYEYYLSRAELNALLRGLSQDGVIDFDPAVVKAERKQLQDQQRAAGELYYVSDATETIIDIRLDEYRRHPGARRIKNLNKRFRWKDLEQDERRFPQSNAIRRAAAGASRVHSLLDRPGMQRIQ
ncbi:MAG: hypothetical protein ACC648_05590 [Thiohalobacterales bacterium]